MNNSLIEDIDRFIMARVDAGNIETGELIKDKKAMLDMLGDLSIELKEAGSTMFGQTQLQIHEKIYNIIMDACCRYQENGYKKGFIDGLALTNIINSAGTQQGGI